MRIFVLSADGNEADLPAIRQTLDYLGTPYSVYIAALTPGGLTPGRLSNGCRAFYQAIIRTTGDLGYAAPVADGGFVWKSALTSDEVLALNAFQSQFKIRQVTWFTYPTPDFGFNWPTGTSSEPRTATLTAAGKAIFPYINTGPQTITVGTSTFTIGSPASPIVIANAYTYLAQPFDGNTVPLLTDDAGNVLAATAMLPGGRENLALTFDSNQHLLHNMLFGYGLVNWVTRGLFIGERHIYLSPQVDDLFIADDQWVAGRLCSTVGKDFNPDDSGPTIRMTGRDLLATAQWQALKNIKPTTEGLRLTMAFNGVGTTGVFSPDTLTPLAEQFQDFFYWVSHTYDHETLDGMTYQAAKDEFTLNTAVASRLGLQRFSRANIVTPNISGLRDRKVMRAAVDAGIRYLVTDTSQPGYDNPFPNNGIYNPLQPKILMIPRRPVNLFYNVSTPSEWTSEYNCIYNSFFGRDLTYEEILEFVSNQILPYLLRGENDPWMFHQPNLIFYEYDYSGGRSLLTDLLDLTLAKYNGYFNLPIQSPSMNALGASIAARMARLSANVRGTLQPGGGIVLSSDRPVTVPVTGLAIAGAESYGGQPIAWVRVGRKGTVTVPSAP